MDFEYKRAPLISRVHYHTETFLLYLDIREKHIHNGVPSYKDHYVSES